MTETPTLDDLERDLVRALHAKAEQVPAGDLPFAADRPAADPVVRLAPARRRGRVLAVAAAVAVVAGALGALALDRRGGDGSVATAPVAAVRYGAAGEGTAGVALPAPPPGWTLREVDAGARSFEQHDARWQLFGDDGASPMTRGVLVGSVVDVEGRVIESASHTVHGEPASVVPSPEPMAPTGALQASWIDGDVVHDATAVGMTGDELVAFLDALVPHDEPADGFRAPAGSPLPEVAASTAGGSLSSRFTYAVPGAPGSEVAVSAASTDRYAGLLHRMAGERTGGGLAVRGRLGGDGLPFVSLARDDGWTVDVLAHGTSPADAPALLDAALAGLAPVTRQEVLDMALDAPVTATHAVGGWRVEVHGTAAEDVALCLSPEAGEPVCTTAESAPSVGLTSGSVLLGGEWVVVTVTDGARAATVQTAPESLAGGWPPDFSPTELGGEQHTSGEHVVGIVEVPPGVGAVDVLVIDGSYGVGSAGYARPAG